MTEGERLVIGDSGNRGRQNCPTTSGQCAHITLSSEAVAGNTKDSHLKKVALHRRTLNMLHRG